MRITVPPEPPSHMVHGGNWPIAGHFHFVDLRRLSELN
jgi:hypothetical protein